MLLAHGDVLHLGPSLSLTYNAPSLYRPGVPRTRGIQQAERKSFAHLYAISKRRLGQGGHGHVYMAVDKESKLQLACKVIEIKDQEAEADPLDPQSTHKSGMTKQQRQKKRKRPATETAEYIQKIKREFDILKDLKHANIIALERVFVSESTIYIFQELVRGGDLFSYVTYYSDKDINGEPIGHLPEASAAIVAYQIVKAVAYLHSEGVLHRDLKPDNVLMSSLSHGARVVLTDFGAAIKLPTPGTDTRSRQQQLARVMSLVGTEDYFAPEIYACRLGERTYTHAIDLYAIGLITAIMLGGTSLYHVSHPPHHGNPTSHGHDVEQSQHDHAAAWDLTTHQEDAPAPHAHTSQEARSADRLRRIYTDFERGLPQIDTWTDIGIHGKDFVRKLLHVDDTQRMTTEQALHHPWLANETYGKSLEGAYERAVAGWKPGPSGKGLIQQIRLENDGMVVGEMERDRKVLRLEPQVPVCESRYFEEGDTDPRKRVVTGGTPMKENFRLSGRMSGSSRGMVGSSVA